MIPSTYVTVDNVHLGSWISHQRKNYKKGTLSPARMEMLEKIGMIWDPWEVKWHDIYEEALKYYIENGNLLVPYNFISDKGTNLGAWISNQRDRYKNGIIEPIVKKQNTEVG